MPDKKIAIVGCADSKFEAPWEEKDWEIWGVNNMFHSMPQVRKAQEEGRLKWFEIHNIHYNGKQWFRRGVPVFRGQNVNDYVNDLIGLNCPIYMHKHWDEIPTSIEYPLADVIGKFGNYITNTISYEMAVAMLDPEVKEIGIWGVDMAVYSKNFLGNEYSFQRPSCEYFIGLARGMGIKVIVPNTSDLLKTRFLYGFQEPQEKAFNAKLNRLKQTIMQKKAEAAEKKNQALAQENQYIGAEHAVDEITRIWD